MSATPPAPPLGSHAPPATAAADASQTRRPIRRALVSVHDKTGLADLAAALHASGVEIVSTGGSAAVIAGLGVPVTSVEQLTGFPECLEGRVKTLHPRVHAGILADTRKADHLRQLDDLDVQPFELVVANLYPFAATVASGASAEESVEQIDIGGPAMVRAAAKNHASVAVVTSPTAYALVVRALQTGGFTLAERQRLAAAAFAHTASYDVQVATWMSGVAPPPQASGTAPVPGAPEDPGAPELPDAFPAWLGATWLRADSLRYGENPHQRAALYRAELAPPGLAQAPLLHGKAMSFNNYVDADAALRAAHDHGDMPTVAIVKHANPCGLATGGDVAQAHARAHACDPVSAFGGIVATNRPVTAAMAAQVAEVFTEVVLAPHFEPEALTILTAKKNLRLLQVGAPPRGRPGASPGDGMDGAETRPISGGLLAQDRDAVDAPGDDPAAWQLAAGRPADEATLHDLAFAWRAVRAVKSNAILLARDGASVGIGMGQVNRVDSCDLAVRRAGPQRARGSVAASDAFFPFADGLQVLIDAGVRAVVSPGGSVRDEEVAAAAAAAGVTLYFTGTRHFAH